MAGRMTPAGERWTAASLLELAVSVAALAAVLALFARFVAGVEARPGVVLPDPVLARLAPRDLTWLVFAVLYGSIPVAVISLARRPRVLLLGVRAYALMVLLRVGAMALTPLDPPPGTIPLHDPLVQALGTSGHVLTRDLFFSGHTATMALLFFTARRPATRAFFGAATLLVGGAVLWQAVHYAVDVYAAPVFAYAAYRLAGALRPPAP